MSTLNRALSKIYGRAVPRAHDAPSVDKADGSDSQDAADGKISDGPPVPAPHLRFHAEPEATNLLGGGSQQTADVASAVGDASSELRVSNSSELSGEILRIDGPSSVVAAPPHFDLAEIESYHSIDSKVAEVEPEPTQADDDTDDKAVVDPDRAAPDRELDGALDLSEMVAERPPRPVTTLHPEWEVDRFRWPETCQRLLLEKGELLQAAVDSLCQIDSRGGTIVGLVGEQAGDGVSTMALCLARCAAQQGRRVIVVDADISSPGLATILGLNTPCSWHDSIVGEAPLAESIVLSVEDQLCLMPLHLDCQQSNLMLTNERVAELLREASAANDLIVVDCGSMERLADRADMVDGQLSCDVAVIVRDASRSQDSEAENISQDLRQLQVRRVMLAENFVHLPKLNGDGLKSSAA